MSNLTIEMFPAAQGDCFLVSFGELPKRHILIDGGLKETYYKYLKPRLIELDKMGEQLDLLVVTHIDEDHIEGIIELIKDNGSAANPLIIGIAHIWHNSYKHLQFEKEKIIQIDNNENEILKGIITANHICNINNESEEISYKQGSSLAGLICAGGYKWNYSFSGGAVNIDNINTINIDTNTVIKLLSPNTEKLNQLGAKWIKELNKQKYGFRISDEQIFDDAFEFFMLKERRLQTIESDNISLSHKRITLENLLGKASENDISVTNGSSISFIFEHEDKKVLFLSDSHPDLIIRSIHKLINSEGYIPYFDVIKISHHGSRYNTSIDLLRVIDSCSYLVSTNGKKHHHPDLETLSRIVCRSREIPIKLIFNYPTEGSVFINNRDWMNEHNYVVEIAEDDRPIVFEI